MTRCSCKLLQFTNKKWMLSLKDCGRPFWLVFFTFSWTWIRGVRPVPYELKRVAQSVPSKVTRNVIEKKKTTATETQVCIQWTTDNKTDPLTLPRRRTEPPGSQEAEEPIRTASSHLSPEIIHIFFCQRSTPDCSVDKGKKTHKRDIPPGHPLVQRFFVHVKAETLSNLCLFCCKSFNVAGAHTNRQRVLQNAPEPRHFPARCICMATHCCYVPQKNLSKSKINSCFIKFAAH